MPSFHRSTLGEFLSLSDEQILARLSIGYARRGYTSQYTDQTLTWKSDIGSLRSALQNCVEEQPRASQWGILLEYSIPRKELRIDIVLLIGSNIVIVEAKSGSAFTEARRQIQEYALLLHYFHKASADRRIFPIIVSPHATEPDLDPIRQMEMFPQLATYWIADV